MFRRLLSHYSSTGSRQRAAFFLILTVMLSLGISSQIGIVRAAPITFTPLTLPDGTVGTPYPTQTVTASGGVGVLTLTHTGNVPPGLNFDDASGNLTGTPTDASNSPYTFTVTATDTLGPSDFIDYTININEPIYSSAPAVGNPINLGNTPVGTLLTVATALTITNTGTAPLNVSNLVLSGGDMLEFAINTAFPMPAIAANGGTATISLSCTPTIAATRTTTLTVTHDAAGSPTTYVVNCTGNPPSPVYSSVPAVGNPINLGSTNIGSPITRPTALVISNTGTAPLNIIAISIAGGNIADFTLNTTTLPAIATGGSGNVSISCKPSAAGIRSTVLTITHNAPGSPTQYTVNCTGVVPGSPIYVSNPGPSSTINIGTVQIGTAISVPLTISNNGLAPATLSVTIPGNPPGLISGLNAADFAITSPPTFQGLSIAGKVGQTVSSQTLTIRCIPSASGLRIATLTLKTNDPNQLTVTYALACTGSGTVVPTVTPIGFVATATAFVIPPTAVLPATGTVIEVKGLAMRTGPYLGATLVGKIVTGQPYSILARSNDEGGGITWYLVTTKEGVTGWVSGLFLNVTGNIDAAPFQGSIFDQIDGAPDTGISARAMSIIDIRRRPSGRAAIIGQIPHNGTMTLLGRTRQNGGDFWVQVNYNGIIGWIPAAPISGRGNTGTVPIR